MSVIVVNLIAFSFLVHLQSFEADSFKGTSGYRTISGIMVDCVQARLIIPACYNQLWKEKPNKKRKKKKKTGKENIYRISFMHSVKVIYL